MIRNIFFDFNGTILDDLQVCFEIESEMFEMEGLPQISLDFYKDNFSFPVKEYYRKVGFDVDTEGNYDRLAKYFFSEYTKRQQAESKLHDGLVECLGKLKNDGYKLFILTATERKLLIEQLKYLGIAGFFDGFAACDDIHAGGKIEYGRDFIKENNLDPKESIMIGDCIHDYEVAIEIGLKPVLFSQGHNSLKTLNQVDAPIVNSYEEFYEFVKNS
jgi:phosphoglycolate phosphatase